MKTALTVASWLGLLLTLAPPVLMVGGVLDAPGMKSLMLAGALVWFGAQLLVSRGWGQAPPA
jgi:hypothetical protein